MRSIPGNYEATKRDSRLLNAKGDVHRAGFRWTRAQEVVWSVQIPVGDVTDVIASDLFESVDDDPVT